MKKLHKIEGESMIVEYSMDEFLEQIQKPGLPSRGEASSDDDNPDWYGTRNYEQANQLLMYGDKKAYEKLHTIKAKTDVAYAALGRIRVKNEASPVGYQPIVPNAIMGLPNSMTRSVRQSVKQKVIDIFLNMSFSGMTSRERIISIGATTLSTVESLERAGYRCNVYLGVIHWNGRDDVVDGFFFKFKNALQPINTFKASCYFVNASFLRRHGFRIAENEELLKDVTHNGYGQVTSFPEQRDAIRAAVGDEVVIIDSRCDMRQVGDDEDLEHNVSVMQKLLNINSK